MKPASAAWTPLWCWAHPYSPMARRRAFPQDRLDDGIALYSPSCAEAYHERRQRHRIVQRGARYEAIRHCARRAQRGHLLRPRGVLHVRKHVSREVCVRVPAHCGGNADVSPVSRAVVGEKFGMQATGVPSDYHEYQKQLQYDIREVPARTKDFFKALFRMPSTYVVTPLALTRMAM